MTSSSLEKVPGTLHEHLEEASSHYNYFETNLTDNEVSKRVDEIITTNPDLLEYSEILHKGAILANDDGKITPDRNIYTAKEIKNIEYESAHSIRSQGFAMFLVAIAGSFSAINFGMDESAVGGAQLQYINKFNIINANVQGTVNAAPYLAAGTLGTVSTVLLDQVLGRRAIIFISALFGIGGSLWQALAQSFGSLLVARLFLGIGMGLNSSVVPIFIGETSPAKSRGSFLMLWQTFVAFGVMLGSVFNRAFVGLDPSISWRLMIGSSFVPPLFVVVSILFAPESPRYLLTKRQAKKALEALLSLRGNELSAARDFIILYTSLNHANEIDRIPIFKQIRFFFVDRRIRFAFLGASFLIVMQQYCGVNILVGYTTTILVGAGVSDTNAIAGSIGIGGGCFLSTFFSSQTIDRVGRRRMLLYTFPVLGGCLFWLGGSLYISDSKSRLGSALTSMYVFVFGFGLGIGPISWIYNAEVYPLHVRAFGSTVGMTINWILDFVLSMSWPQMNKTMTSSGGLFFYGAMNFLAFVLTYFFIPETAKLTLEEVDFVFSSGVRKFSSEKLGRLFGTN
ncbi:hypothetical protein DASC09_051530 [Saccharomycopsis crataegensis]|uniref:Major facilitator superfamily (MFS) profile domain-containing protein n=1 Tax=Saccharomycopsis crataegensis TaxID=43959 RepID=A0AAV5QUL5_9ASCO|nr:hypothetical protein DASC09_051530 [Saccharomycopsis crataegensis]